ncbi:unnamed protein product [Rotaria sordida]|uniref:protein-disulfide reductase n=1 Tax=Rotaria sordida TaxID=392033 RepID=A0A815ABH9_9BILA|nr:unnamed protein product [Rotaria sordida]
MKWSDLLGESVIEGNARRDSNIYRHVPISELDNKVVAIYFSAHWCGPCQNFTPKLATCYGEVQSELQDRFEIVFVSSDKDDKSFNEYFQTMPWKAIPFSDRDRKTNLSEKFKVDGIPTLVVLSADGVMLTPDGCDDIDSKGSNAIRSWLKDEPKSSTVQEEYLWPGVSCNGCQINPLIGERHKCSTCVDYNLCSACHKKKVHEHELTVVPNTLATVSKLVCKDIDVKP